MFFFPIKPVIKVVEKISILQIQPVLSPNMRPSGKQFSVFAPIQVKSCGNCGNSK